MANHYFGITIPGGGTMEPDTITVSTSTTGKNLELVVLDGVSGNKNLEIVNALEQLVAYFSTADAPV